MSQVGLHRSLEEAAARLLMAAEEDPARAAKLRTMAAQLQALCLEIEGREITHDSVVVEFAAPRH